ncbi:MAG: hypothetical protein MK108_16845 [Mariniblastus sp.]|nr:hypothetical protein [Mariniblastus sp.]
MERDKQEKSSDSARAVGQVISVPRWIIYFQGALLGVVAATFFVFGMMVGSLTRGGSTDETRWDCQVTGQVLCVGERGERGDAGAVVLLLPRDRRPEKRMDGQSVNPNSFEPLNNPVIDFIHASGGAVVRTDDQGRFDSFVQAPNTYFLLVISRHQAKPAGRSLTRSEMAALGSYFSSVEDLLGDQDYHWQTRFLDSSEANLGTIQF